MVKLFSWTSFALLLLIAPVWADPLPTLPAAGSWAAFPNSTLRPAMGTPPWNPAFIFDYSGGTFDDDRNELVVWGGGHADYPGNEVCTFPFATGLWVCGPRSAYTTATVDTLADGTPAARHTAGCLVRVNLPGWDGFFCHGGSIWQQGWPVNATWFYHRETRTWENLGPKPLWGESDYGGTTLYSWGVFDAARGQALVRTRNKCFAYVFATRSFVWAGNCPNMELDISAAYDPSRRVLVLLGSGFMEVWNTSTTPWTAVSATLLGDQTPKTAHGPGLVFDPIGQQYIAHAGGKRLYFINRDTWAVTTVDGAGADPGPAYSSSGNQGRFRYVANTQGLLVVSSIDSNVFYYQLGTPPPPPPPPPTYPVTLATTGTGSGTVSGAGAYTAGAIVTLTATALVGSTFAGWSPPPCGATFSMPAFALLCTATFTLNPPPPPPPVNPRVDITITKPAEVDIYLNGVLVP
jgi:hypothetical protein